MKKIFGILAVISFIVLLITAGASDQGSISLIQIIIQGSISVIALGIFSKFSGAFDIKQS